MRKKLLSLFFILISILISVLLYNVEPIYAVSPNDITLVADYDVDTPLYWTQGASITFTTDASTTFEADDMISITFPSNVNMNSINVLYDNWSDFFVMNIDGNTISLIFRVQMVFTENFNLPIGFTVHNEVATGFITSHFTSADTTAPIYPTLRLESDSFTPSPVTDFDVKLVSSFAFGSTWRQEKYNLLRSNNFANRTDSWHSSFNFNAPGSLTPWHTYQAVIASNGQTLHEPELILYSNFPFDKDSFMFTYQNSDSSLGFIDPARLTSIDFGYDSALQKHTATILFDKCDKWEYIIIFSVGGSDSAGNPLLARASKTHVDIAYSDINGNEVALGDRHTASGEFLPNLLFNTPPWITGVTDRIISRSDMMEPSFDLTNWLLDGVQAGDAEDGDPDPILPPCRIQFPNLPTGLSDKTPGEYTVTYQVVDNGGLSVEETATIIIIDFSFSASKRVQTTQPFIARDFEFQIIDSDDSPVAYGKAHISQADGNSGTPIEINFYHDATYTDLITDGDWLDIFIQAKTYRLIEVDSFGYLTSIQTTVNDEPPEHTDTFKIDFFPTTYTPTYKMDITNIHANTLTVTKTVQGAYANTTQEFDFKLDVNYLDGAPYTDPILYRKLNADGTFTDGTWISPASDFFTFKLAHNEKIIFSNIGGIDKSRSVSYQVTEIKLPSDYSVTVTSDPTATPISNGVSGSIGGSVEHAQANFFNIKTDIVPTSVSITNQPYMLMCGLGLLLGITYIYFICKQKKTNQF